MKILGITGGSGSGKTTALFVLEELGAKIIDCDKVYHDLMDSNAEMKNRIESVFPNCVSGGKIDRKALGGMVFGDEKALEKLNDITHDYVVHEVKKILSDHERTGGQLAAIDAIGLIESGLGHLCDFTVAVISPIGERVARLAARDGISEEYAMARIHAQKSDDFFCENCTYCIENSGFNRVEFEEKVLSFIKPILDGGGEDA